MKLKQGLGFLTLSLILIFSGCTGNPFTTNFFESLDQVEADINTGALTGATNDEERYSAVEDLLGEQGADDFDDYLKGDGGQDIIDVLEVLISTPPTAEQKDTYQEAGVLLAHAELVHDGGAAAAVENVNNVLLDLIENASDDNEDILSNLAEEIFSDSTDVAASLRAMMDAAAALTAVGATMESEDDLSSDIDMGEAGDTAIVVALFDAMVTETMLDNPGFDQDDAIDALAAFIESDDGVAPFDIEDTNDLTFNSNINTLIKAGTPFDLTDLPF